MEQLKHKISEVFKTMELLSFTLNQIKCGHSQLVKILLNGQFRTTQILTIICG